MKLSICMMVKDEEKYIEKCLIHLKELMNSIESELIIVDTGSTDNTMTIAKRYTDRVYFHKWNNNFSDMRNITISYAKGEWIFITDADEMLVEYKSIVKFLNSQHVEEYNTVFMTIKNLSGGEDSDNYSTLSSARIFKNDGEFKYEGAVHNKPLFKEPSYYSDALIEHYGYIINDKNVIEKKFQRTATILKNELEKDPDNIYYWYQLSVSYSMHNDEQDAIDTAVKAFQIMEKNIGKEEAKEYIYVYTQLALCYMKIKDFRIVEYICDKAIKAGIEHIDIYYLLGKSQLITEKNYEAIDAYEKYLVLLDKYKFKENRTVQIYYHGKREYVFFDLFILYKRIGQYHIAVEYCNKIKDEFIITNEEFLEENIKLYLDINDYCGLERFYYDVIIKHNIENWFILHLEKYMDNKDLDLCRVRSIFRRKNSYTDLLDFRMNINNNSNSPDNMDEIYDISKFNFNELYYFYGDILYYYMKKSWDKFSDLVKNLREKKIVDFFRYIHEKYDDFLELLFKGLHINYNENVDNMVLKKIIAKYLVIVLNPQHISYMEVFNIYIKCGISYLDSVYNVELLEKEKIYWLKDEEEVFFLYMRKANLLKYSDEKGYLYYLKKALNVYPYMNSGVKLLLDEFKQNQEKSEMEIYKNQVIATIKALIEGNKLEEAKEIINEYEKIIPSDPKIQAIKSML